MALAYGPRFRFVPPCMGYAAQDEVVPDPASQAAIDKVHRKSCHFDPPFLPLTLCGRPPLCPQLRLFAAPASWPLSVAGVYSRMPACLPAKVLLTRAAQQPALAHRLTC